VSIASKFGSDRDWPSLSASFTSHIIVAVMPERAASGKCGWLSLLAVLMRLLPLAWQSSPKVSAFGSRSTSAFH
jgi:hypothetical protein